MTQNHTQTLIFRISPVHCRTHLDSLPTSEYPPVHTQNDISDFARALSCTSRFTPNIGISARARTAHIAWDVASGSVIRLRLPAPIIGSLTCTEMHIAILNVSRNITSIVLSQRRIRTRGQGNSERAQQHVAKCMIYT